MVIEEGFYWLVEQVLVWIIEQVQCVLVYCVDLFVFFEGQQFFVEQVDIVVLDMEVQQLGVFEVMEEIVVFDDFC